MQLSRVITFFIAITWSSAALAVPRETCMGAAESSQELRKRGKLQSAREQLAVCAQKGCPTFVRKDCLTWLAEVDAAIPSVSLRARDESGAALTDVRVLVDGTVVATELKPDAKVELDPGAHVVRFERADGVVAEERITLSSGDKSKVVSVTLKGTVKRDVPPPPEAPVDTSDHVPVGVYVLGATAIVGAGSFAFFALTGANEYSKLETSCKPRCNSEQTKSVDTKFLVANVSLAVAVASAVGAAVVYFTRPQPTTGPTTTFGVSPLAGGSGAGVWTHFQRTF